MNSESQQKELGIVGESLEIKEIVHVIQQVAPTDITVLITGESGVGKEVIAKAIHKASSRKNKPMISVNAGAIPEGIIESELFGHEKGAFTGASETRKGYFELADGGTVFLDEIGELPLGTQVKFLRVLESGEYMRVGSATPRKVDVRVIAATNKDLNFEVRHGRFRTDLYFRLRPININIPALRQRVEDIRPLIEYFTEQLSEKKGYQFGGISEEAIETLEAYSWPGNVRELKNVVESLLVLGGGVRIESDGVKRYLRLYYPPTRNLPVVTNKSPEQAERELIYRALLEVKNDIMEIKQMLQKPVYVNQDMIVKMPLLDVENSHDAPPADSSHLDESVIPIKEMEKRMIIEALRKYHGNRKLVAKALNISERTLYRRAKEYGIENLW
ncbi:MAG: sigma-54-dependent Fis family transcriptional regulator [Ignavibacteriae bacterium]|nr:sigma-54-dependent Fis family transcriptional regulator [Ignavibacteriota bacterium]